VRSLLLIEISAIPPEGLSIDAPLDPVTLHLESERSFDLDPGGRLQCTVERGDDQTVHVAGRLAAGLRLECGRCLEPFRAPFEQDLDLFYLPHRSGDEDESEEEVELSDRDIVVAYFSGGRLDLGEMVREQLLLSLSMKRLCRETCAGLCATCGVNLNAGPCACPPPIRTDPRLAPLQTVLKGRLS
jgi:uncharacterized metal-binding protein YceD (DUF177 family)